MATEENQRYHVCAKVWSAVGFTLIGIALLAMAGMIITLVMFGLWEEKLMLLGILSAGFLGVAASFGIFGFLAIQRSVFFRERELDALERADSEDSFFVGDGVLATFAEKQLFIRGSVERHEIGIPYEKVRVFSLCSRRKPREKGQWSVLIEVPAEYVSKKAKNEPPVLIQTDGKERLYRSLQKRGLTLLGEQPKAQRTDRRYSYVKSFSLPDPAKRKRALLFLLLGAAITAAGVGVCFALLPLGAAAIAVGLYVLGRSALSYTRSKRTLAFFKEGLYLKEPNTQENLFLKWEEISAFSASEDKGVIRAECLYGGYDLPGPAGAYDYIRETFPEKCGA